MNIQVVFRLGHYKQSCQGHLCLSLRVDTCFLFSLGSTNVSLSLDTCYRTGFPSGLTRLMRRQETKSPFWCPQDPRTIVRTQRCPVSWALVPGGSGRGSPGRGKPASVNFKCAGKLTPLHFLFSHPDTFWPRFLFSSHIIPSDDHLHASWTSWTIPGSQRWTQSRNLNVFPLSFCYSPCQLLAQNDAVTGCLHPWLWADREL